MIYRRFCLESVARSQVTDNTGGNPVVERGCEGFVLRIVPSKLGLGRRTNNFSLYNIIIHEIFHKTSDLQRPSRRAQVGEEMSLNLRGEYRLRI
jgi:hypothetical protein